MLQSVDRLIIYCIVIRLAVTQGQRLQSQNGRDLASKPSESDVKCSEDVSCYTDGNSLVDTIANIDSQVLCQQLCQMRDNCGFYTWFDEQSTEFPRICFHFETCNDREPCADCHSAPPTCSSTLHPITAFPEDCSAIVANPPPHGTLECYTTNEGKDECHLSCDPGFATPGPSIVPCTRREGTILSCEPAVVLVTGGDQAMQQVEVYSSSTNSCRLSLPSLHGPYSDHSLDYVDGNVILCGGSTYSDTCLTLLPNLTWTSHSNLTTSRTHQASAAYRNSLLLMGGEEYSTEVWRPATGWLAGLPLPQTGSIDGCASRISTSEILLTGGHPCPTCSFIFNWETGEWKKTAGDLGEGRSSHGCASYISPEDSGVRVLVAGGWSGHNIRTAEVFNPATEMWRVVGDLTSPRRGLTLVTAEGGRVMALGGRYSTAVADVDIFDPEIETWTAGPPLLWRRAFHATTSVPATMLRCQLSD